MVAGRRSMLFVVVLFAAAAIPLAGGVTGTEANPELVDPAGDVNYDIPPDEPHDYMDILAAWFEYDGSSDRVSTIVKVADVEALNPPPTDWKLTFAMYVGIDLDGEDQGNVAYTWESDPATGNIQAEVFVQRQVGGEDVPISHVFTGPDEGTIRFSVGRQALLDFGDAFVDQAIVYEESYLVGSVNPGNVKNSDRASGDGIFNLFELAPTGSPPVDELDQPEGNGTDEATDEPRESTPAPGIVGVVLAATISGWVARRNQF
jgi:hypothetical protein